MTRLYVPLCVDYYTDAKILAAGEAAEVLYIRALGLAKTLPSDGFLTDGQVRLLGLVDVESRAASLAAQGLWLRKDSGWQITAWLRHNLPATEIEAFRERKRAAGRAGGRKSAEARRQSSASAGGEPGGEPGGERLLKQPGEAKGKRSGSGSGSGSVQPPSESVPPTPQQRIESSEDQEAEQEQPHIGQRLNDLWRQHGLGAPRGYDWLQGAIVVTALTAHFTDDEILSAPAKIVSTPGLAWVAKRGPAYLAEQIKGRTVLEAVLSWDDRQVEGPGRNGKMTADEKAAAVEAAYQRMVAEEGALHGR